MSISIGLIYDIAFLALLLITALVGLRRGFASGIIRLAGSVAGIVGAVYVTREWAPLLYDRYIGPVVSERVAEVVAQQSAEAPELAAKGLAFLPEAALQSILELLQAASESGSAELVQRVTDALQPLILPLLQAVLFLAAVVLIKLVFGLLERLFRHLNGVPLLGTFNKIFGFCFGFVTGTLDCWIASLVLWLVATVSAGALSFLNTEVLAQSLIYTFFSNFNPFLVHY